jgi:hypothetical protein
MTTQNRIKIVLTLIAVLGIAASFSTPLLAASDIFSVNFWAPGRINQGPDTEWNRADWLATIQLEEDEAAGLGDWNTTGWLNYRVPWGLTVPQEPITLTSTQGSTATFTFNDCRNGGPYHWTTLRTTLLEDPNADMMDGHINSTLDGASNKLDMDVSDIPFDTYDVIVYLGANEGQYGDGTGKIVFNDGPEQDFTLPPGEFAAFTEIVNGTTPGNYIVFEGVKGSSFSIQTWGLGPTGFNHLGPTGFQFRYAVTDANEPDVDAGLDMISWSGQAVQLDPNIVEAEGSDWTSLTYLWTAEPNGIGDPNLDVVITDADTENAMVTITKTVPTGDVTVVTMTLAVNNAGNPPDDAVTDTMTIDVYDDACLAALDLGLATIDTTDLDGNCITAFPDFAVMAATWLDDYMLTEAVAK